MIARGDGFRLDRHPAATDLSELVERHWLVSWELPAGRASAVTLLPHPCVNLVFDGGTVSIAGVGLDRFTYPYQGTGRVFGVKFRPGAFLPFLRPPPASPDPVRTAAPVLPDLTGRTVPLARLWGADDAAALADELATASVLPEFVQVAERHLRAHWPAPDPEVARVGRIVHALLHDRSITRVDQVSRRFGLSQRSLQRLFQRYVGVSPKWVLRRYRLHEAAARLAQGGSWADIATDLGYFDQSHFIRDFALAVGVPPSAYADAGSPGSLPLGV